MTAKLVHGNMQCLPPAMAGGEFRQVFEFTAPVVITPRAMQQITKSVVAQFRRTIETNKITEFVWPPRRVEVWPHDDMMGFRMELGTPAREPGVVVIQTAH